MKEILEYKSVKADTSEGLTFMVNNLIEEGWQPIGGMCVSIEVTEELQFSSFHQAVVRYGDDL